MFTPPPSPLPIPRIIVTDEPESESGSESDSRLRIEEEGKTKKKDKNSSELDSSSPLHIIPSSQSGEKSFSSRKEQQQQTKMKVQVTPTQAQAQAIAAAEAIIRDYERKKRTARRTRWAVLLVPAILVLVAFTSRRVSMPFDALDELEEALGRGVDVDANVDVIDWMRAGDDASLLVPLRSEVRTDSVVPPLQSESERHEQTYRIHHIQNHKRQTLSLTNPAAPSSSILITPDASNSALNSDSGSVSPTGTDSSSSPTTTVPQTEQTIPPVPDTSNPPVLPTPFPQPFDTTGATSNVTTQACANFFTNMTQTLPFRSCRPFSLLEQFSSEFIEQAQTNLTLLNTLIFGTCTTSTPLDTCTANMDWFASSLSSSCSSELSQNNLMVTQTLLGLQSYALLRQAACLVNQQSNTYCYASAAHDASPADLYLYQLPLGIGFPVATTQPSCSTCAKSVLALYADALRGGNSSARGLRGTYEPAASLAESVCGTGFASVGVATGGSSGAAAARSWGSWGGWWAVVMSACVLASSVLAWL
ncbi:hypothetical protein ACEPAI_9815 [Sanghuangporus weigelae]